MKTIGIIGYGNMGAAIAERIKLKYTVRVFDKEATKTKGLVGVSAAESAVSLALHAEAIILAVKPQDMETALNEIKEYSKGRLIISIAAGVTTGYLEKVLGQARVIRVMPNLPAVVAGGVSCLSKGKFATNKDLAFSLRIFKRLGVVFVFGEEMMDAATAVSGSGPGFFYYFLQAHPENKAKDFMVSLCQAAESVGFNKRQAKLLADFTVKGSLALARAMGCSAEKLKQRVASKGGTTEAGLEVLRKGGSLSEAVQAALKRAKELAMAQ